MKVDKAVCTTETMTEAQSAISYETLLSTLVQKKIQQKILAIKRECEAKNLAKQKRKEKTCLGSLIFSNRNNRSSRRPSEEVVTTNPSISQQTTVTRPMETKIKNDDNQDVTDSSELAENRRHANAIDATVLLNCAQVAEICVARDSKMLAKMESTKCHIDVLNERGAGGNDNNLKQTNDHLNSDSNTSNVKCGIRMVNSCCGSQNVSKNFITDDAQSTQSKKSDNSVIALDIESSSTTTNSKSTSIVSQIEVSDETNAKLNLRTRKNSSDTISVPSSMKHTTLSAPAETMALHDQEQSHQIHLLEAKSISAQCSPVLAQRQNFTGMYAQLLILYVRYVLFRWLLAIVANFHPVSHSPIVSRVVL